MIEVKTDVTEFPYWQGKPGYCYLELYGETRPTLAENDAQASPSTALQDHKQAPPPPTYEYWWTLGHSLEGGEEEPHPFDVMASSGAGFWDSLREVNGAAARVYLFFPVSGNWRTKELAATLKYLSPVQQPTSRLGQLSSDLHLLSPVAQDMSNLVGLVPNPAATGVAALLATIAKLQINNVPPSRAINWSALTVTHGKPPDNTMQGVGWNIPKSAFQLLGSRLTGSLALSFIPSQVQAIEDAGHTAPEPEARQIEAHAVIYGPNKEDIWIPSKTGFTKLYVHPVVG